MNTLAKALFPNQPQFIRFRKLQSLYFTILLGAAASAAAALSIVLNYLVP